MTAQGPVRLTAGVVVVRWERGHSRFLVLRAYRNWDFPKGMVESEESPLHAARREVAEETGITRLEFKWGRSFIDTAPYSGNKVARFFVAETPVEEVRLSWEHHEARWLPYRSARTLLHPRLKAVLDWAYALVSA